MTEYDLSRAEKFLVHCGLCDYGMPEHGCNCPPGDPRSTIADLVEEVKRLRAIVHMPAEALARRFHETYERLAPSFGYRTREASAKPWDEVPEDNRNLMIAVCAELFPAALDGGEDKP